MGVKGKYRGNPLVCDVPDHIVRTYYSNYDDMITKGWDSSSLPINNLSQRLFSINFFDMTVFAHKTDLIVIRRK